MNLVDFYIADFPEDVRDMLNDLRIVILDTDSRITEGFSYRMPAYKFLGKPLVYFAAYKAHIGFYALPTATAKFENELKMYKRGKGSIQFPIDQPMPYELIRKILKYRIEKIINE